MTPRPGCPSGGPARDAVPGEYDGGHVLRGVALALLSGVAAWAGLALALRAVLG